MLTDDELPPLPTPEMVMVRLTAMQHLAAERFDADQLRDYGRTVERAAYKAAIKACTPHEDDDALDCQAKRECIDAIRSLMEQPK